MGAGPRNPLQVGWHGWGVEGWVSFPSGTAQLHQMLSLPHASRAVSFGVHPGAPPQKSYVL